MPKTLLAVDDSVTMRKVLEITFSGEDYRVITAENAQSALGKLGENPNVFVVDTGLGGDDGYQLAKELRRRSPQAPIIMLASRYSPYDQGRGRDAGADDYADKPFDTQQLIDKVKKAVIAREAGGGGASVGGAPQEQPYRAPAPPQAMPTPAAMPPQPMPAREPPPAYRPPAAAAAPPQQPMSRGTQPSLAGSVPRTGTLVFGEQPAPPPAPSPPAPPAAAPPPAPPPRMTGAMATQQAAPSPAARVDAAVNGQLAGKLGELGLTREQADAVLALSRDVVERVVWEVVPQLAEAMIKEEIARLTKD